MLKMQRMDVTTETFAQDVIGRSHEVPVVVDFWASWCRPCLALGPVLEKEAEARDGQLELVKIDVDANQQLAAEYDVRGIPAVKAFRNGHVVNEFVGAIPPPAVAAFLDEVTGPSAAERLIEELRASGELPEVAEALEREDYEQAFEVLLEEVGAAEGERRDWLRTRIVGLFLALGQEHPVTIKYRKRLATILF
jgi:putative thioredoxin